MKVSVPDPAHLAVALAGRLDRLEAHIDGMDRDVTALGRGLGGVSAVLHDLTATLDDRLNRLDPIDSPDGEPAPLPRCWVDAAGGHPDHDEHAHHADAAEAAAEWLLDVHAWVAERWDLITAGVHLPACWPWHPRAVTELLALQGAHAAAYQLGPLVVVDFEHRHLPDGIEVLGRILAGCSRAGTHVDAAGAHLTTPATTGPDGRPSPDGEQALIDLAHWWVSDRAERPAAAPGIARVVAVTR